MLTPHTKAREETYRAMIAKELAFVHALMVTELRYAESTDKPLNMDVINFARRHTLRLLSHLDAYSGSRLRGLSEEFSNNDELPAGASVPTGRDVS